MGSLLIKNVDAIVTLDQKNTIYRDANLFIKDGFIAHIGQDGPLSADRVIDGKGMAVYPGLINTHHHLYQVLTRNLPQVQNMELFSWLKTLYQIWRGLTEEMVYTGAIVGLGELVKFGCTTTSDHHYVFPRGQTRLIDAQIRAAREVGIRFTAVRGSMSMGESQGGLPPDDLVEDESAILTDSERLIQQYHNPDRGSMVQVALAPCSPFSVTANLMKESAKLARRYGVRLHTHLAETKDEEEFCLSITGLRPLAYMESLGWLGDDVWYAHGVHLNEREIQLMGETGTGVAHCPVSNQKLASGVADIPAMLVYNVPVGLAVDGSASNDGSNLLAEVRACYLLHRLRSSNRAPDGTQVLRMATQGGARVLGRHDIGSLETGKAGDCFLISLHRLEFAGALEDLSALPAVVGITRPVDMTIVNGQVIYEDGYLIHIDEEKAVDQANRMVKQLVKGL